MSIAEEEVGGIGLDNIVGQPVAWNYYQTTAGAAILHLATGDDMDGRSGLFFNGMKETRANALEKVTYKWTTHYFEGIGETNLVLQPPSATNRDGILGGNSLFPNAYLYTQGDRLEWRF